MRTDCRNRAFNVGLCSTQEAAQKIGVPRSTLARWVQIATVNPPKGGAGTNSAPHLWTPRDVLLARLAKALMHREMPRSPEELIDAARRASAELLLLLSELDEEAAQ